MLVKIVPYDKMLRQYCHINPSIYLLIVIAVPILKELMSVLRDYFDYKLFSYAI